MKNQPPSSPLPGLLFTRQGKAKTSPPRISPLPVRHRIGRHT
ncbi:hypothetical protein [Craterilacuibacter sinensis]|nr:hypothetical protein [Craterilacuibacter sinensis]